MKERVIRQEGKAVNIRGIMKDGIISWEKTYMDTSVRSNHLQDDHNPWQHDRGNYLGYVCRCQLLCNDLYFLRRNDFLFFPLKDQE